MPEPYERYVSCIEYIRLKNSDLDVSRLCVGGCPMGGYGWGNVIDEDLINTVHAALDREINFFDTADIYGLGKSEEILGKALKERRSKAIIATKFGVRIEQGRTFYDNSSDWIKHAVKASLKRLNTDYIDLYQIHYKDEKTQIAMVIESLERLKEKGYIRYYGLSNVHESDVEELIPYIGKFVSFQDEYSLANRGNESDMLILADKLSLTPFTWGSLGQGILTGKYTRETKFDSTDRRFRDTYVNFHGNKLLKNLEIVNSMKQISNENGKPLPAIAIRFILDQIKNSVVIAGVKTVPQLLSNIESMGWKLSIEHMDQLLEVSK